MKLMLWAAAIGALLAAPASALARPSPHAPDPADPRAAVAPVMYETAFSRPSLPAPDQDAATPDKVWRAANDTVATASGHAGHGAAPAPAGGVAHPHAHAPAHAHAGHAAPAPAAKQAAQPAAGHGKHH